MELLRDVQRVQLARERRPLYLLDGQELDAGDCPWDIDRPYPRVLDVVHLLTGTGLERREERSERKS